MGCYGTLEGGQSQLDRHRSRINGGDKMTRGVIGRVLAGIWLACLTVTAAQLPPEIQVDRHLVRAERLLSEDKPWAALAEMDKIITLKEKHNLTLPDDFHFKHAQVAFAAGRTESAIESVNKYLVGAGRDSEFYQEALELLDSAEEKSRRDEAQRKRIDAERRRAEAIQRQHKELARRQIEAAARPLPQDKLISGGLGPQMVRIAGGRFQYQYNTATHQRFRKWEWVEFDRPFAISKYEVTRGQFEQFVKSTRYRTEAQSDPKIGCRMAEDRYATYTGRKGRSSLRWNRPGFDQEDTHPVVCVSIRDAMAYAEWLSRETGHSYRVPSAAEWQYAFRAGSSSAMLFDDSREARSRREARRRGDDTTICKHGNLRYSSTGSDSEVKCSDGVRHTAEVGRFMSNDVGLHDMIGNVAELVLACGNFIMDHEVDVVRRRSLAPTGAAEKPGNCERFVVALGSSWNRGAYNSMGRLSRPRLHASKLLHYRHRMGALLP